MAIEISERAYDYDDNEIVLFSEYVGSVENKEQEILLVVDTFLSHYDDLRKVCKKVIYYSYEGDNISKIKEYDFGILYVLDRILQEEDINKLAIFLAGYWLNSKSEYVESARLYIYDKNVDRFSKEVPRIKEYVRHVREKYLYSK